MRDSDWPEWEEFFASTLSEGMSGVLASASCGEEVREIFDGIVGQARFQTLLFHVIARVPSSKFVGIAGAIQNLRSADWEPFIFVAPDFRGRGAGTFGLREATRQVSESGGTIVSTVSARNVGALRMNGKSGYRRIGAMMSETGELIILKYGT